MQEQGENILDKISPHIAIQQGVLIQTVNEIEGTSHKTLAGTQTRITASLMPKVALDGTVQQISVVLNKPNTEEAPKEGTSVNPFPVRGQLFQPLTKQQTKAKVKTARIIHTTEQVNTDNAVYIIYDGNDVNELNKLKNTSN